MQDLIEQLTASPPLWVQTEEDSETTLRALESVAGRRVLCIASGGDTPLALLAAGAAEVLAVDVNPAQAAIAELKTCSVRNLDLPAVETLWLADDIDARMEVYRTLENKLTERTRQVTRQWLQVCDSKPLIEQGAMQGVGSELRQQNPALAASIPAWFQTKTLAEQRTYHDQYLAPLGKIVAELRQARAERWFGRGEESDATVAAAMQHQFLARFQHLVRNVRVARNPYAAHMLLGSYPSDAHPWYLTAEGLATVKQATGMIHFLVGDVRDVLASESLGPLDGADLSNVTDVLSESEYRELFCFMARKLRPGSRCVHRNLIWDNPYPVAPGFQRDEAASYELTVRDRSFVYSTITVEVRKL